MSVCKCVNAIPLAGVRIDRAEGDVLPLAFARKEERQMIVLRFLCVMGLSPGACVASQQSLQSESKV